MSWCIRHCCNSKLHIWYGLSLLNSFFPWPNYSDISNGSSWKRTISIQLCYAGTWRHCYTRWVELQSMTVNTVQSFFFTSMFVIIHVNWWRFVSLLVIFQGFLLHFCWGLIIGEWSWLKFAAFPTWLVRFDK